MTRIKEFWTPRFRRRDGGTSAFTLVELLVVLGVITLLLALLLPALGRARASSFKTRCAAQLNNIGRAFQLYTDDHDGWYPPSVLSPDFNPYNVPLVSDYLDSYVDGQKDVFGCPAEARLFPKYGLSYSYNPEFAFDPEQPANKLRQTTSFSLFGSGSQVPLLWDGDNFHGGQLPYNWLFSDGHVEHDWLDKVASQADDPGDPT